MKPNIVSVTSIPASNSLAALPTAKIVRHPRAKKMAGETHVIPPPPDEETLQRLNAMAKQYPFCVQHRGNNYSWLL